MFVGYAFERIARVLPVGKIDVPANANAESWYRGIQRKIRAENKRSDNRTYVPEFDAL